MAQTAKQSPSTKIVTGKVRFSYANLFRPRVAEAGQDPKYSVSLLIPKSDKVTLSKIKSAVEAAIRLGITNQWGGKKPIDLKLPLRDGDVDREDSPEYANHYFMNCNSKQKPGIVDKNLNPILDETEVYSGCYGRASVNFFPYNHKGNRGVACGLNNVQKLADGESLGGRSRAEDDFDEVDDDIDDLLG